MQQKYIFSILFLIFALQSFSQEQYYNSLNIDSDLKKNANAVVRYDNIHLNIMAYDKMVYTNKRIVTVFNESGTKKVGAYLGYSDNITIKKMEARIYSAFGIEIKKFKKKDFIDQSAVPGGTLYSNNRVKYLRYTPINYPYTVVFETEVEYATTAFLPGWRIIEGFNISTENAEYKITNNSGVDVKVNTSNFEEFNVKKLGDYHYSASNLKAIKQEDYSPAFKTYTPNLKAALVEFKMEGVKGTNKSWGDFGKWVNDKLLLDTQQLPDDIIQKVKDLTADAKTDMEKAKIVYQYMQDKTRYISVQVGIGGWKPMLAKDVDRLGYGDCKALTNYTKALLDAVDVKSNYTLVYGDGDIVNIEKEFSSQQGNHAILAVKNNEDYVWLECTSQTSPFGYTANFTDDRDVLVITPDGGEIIHTKAYNTSENLLETTAKVSINGLGAMDATVSSNSYGTQYGQHEGIQTETLKDQKLHFKNYWSYINNLEINSIEYTNNKDSIVFTENLLVKATKYASKTGDRLLIKPNFFNRVEVAPKRYVKRKLPFEVERGFTDVDEYEIEIPNTFEVEAMIEPVSIKNKFGEYVVSVDKEGEKLIYKRKFILNKGSYLKEEYKEFREFWLKIIKHDNSKIVLKSKA